MNNDQLKHFGVLGMHWGIRRSTPEEKAAKDLRKRQEKHDKITKNLSNRIMAYNLAADYANSVLIPKINKKYGKYDWSSLDVTDERNPKGDPKLVKAYRRYINEYHDSFTDVFNQKMVDLYGERPS